MMKFYGEEFEKGEYTIPLKSLLAYEPIMVPESNKEVTNLAIGRLIEEDGSLTKVAKGMTEENYLHFPNEDFLAVSLFSFFLLALLSNILNLKPFLRAIGHGSNKLLAGFVIFNHLGKVVIGVFKA